MFGSNDGSKPAGPVFPTFLLPSIPIPFRRRKPWSPASPPSSPAGPIPSYGFSYRSDSNNSGSHGSTPPSLCTSPSSSVSTAPSSPTSPASPSYFPRFAAALTAEPEEQLGSEADFHLPPPPAAETALARALPDTLRCSTCSADVAYGAQIVSKGFTGRHGRAYLVSPPPPPPTSPLSSLQVSGLPLFPLSLPLHRPSRSSGGKLTKAAPKNSDGGPAAADLVNIRVGRPENRQLVTGAHVVADISCAVCGAKLGWKYVDAREPAQRYKVGKFILETARVVAFRGWEDVPAPRPAPSPRSGKNKEKARWARGDGDGRPHAWEDDGQRRRPDSRGAYGHGDEVAGVEEEDQEVLFDSDDEDECEDIFAGTWDAEAVARRRRSRTVVPRKKSSGL